MVKHFGNFNLFRANQGCYSSAPSQKRFPIRKSGKSRKNADLASRGSGGHFCCKYRYKISQKLRIIILLHLGLETCRPHYWKTLKPLIFPVLGPGGRDHDSQNQLFLIWGAARYLRKSKKIPNHLNILVWEI